LNQKFYGDETSMSSSGIKGFSTSGELYSIIFVLNTPIEKSQQQTMKVSLTSPRDRPVDTSGRFCKECGVKSTSDIAKNCSVCGTILPTLTR
jgi:hypothetical protein